VRFLLGRPLLDHLGIGGMAIQTKGILLSEKLKFVAYFSVHNYNDEQRPPVRCV
jgi:hypothetical protein